MASKLSEHWQDGKTLQECNLHLMEMEYSDIIFRLYYKSENNEEEVADIPALRLLCLARSPVFFAMFNGELAQQPDNRVLDIHDDHADPEAFKQMIRFMYSDDITLTTDNVLAILYLSQKYIISTLSKRCMKFLEESLTPNTAPIVLEQSMLYEEKELKKKTLETIQEEAPAVLASDEFLDVSRDALTEIMKLNLKISKEVTVFEACIKWATNQCQKLQKSPNGENTREVLGNNLYLIRFPTMSVSEYTDVVAPQNVLTDDEGYQVFRYITSDSNKPENLPFLTEQRVKKDESPRSLMIAAPYTTSRGNVKNQEVHRKVTSLSFKITKPVRLRRIYISAPYYHFRGRNYMKTELTVTLNKKRRCLLEYSGVASPDDQLAGCFGVDAGDLRVESGAMDLFIDMKVTRPFSGQGNVHYFIDGSSLKTSQLSDDYVSITFEPTEENLLRGIEYLPLDL